MPPFVTRLRPTNRSERVRPFRPSKLLNQDHQYAEYPYSDPYYVSPGPSLTVPQAYSVLQTQPNCTAAVYCAQNLVSLSTGAYSVFQASLLVCSRSANLAGLTHQVDYYCTGCPPIAALHSRQPYLTHLDACYSRRSPPIAHSICVLRIPDRMPRPE